MLEWLAEENLSMTLTIAGPSVFFPDCQIKIEIRKRLKMFCIIIFLVQFTIHLFHHVSLVRMLKFCF